MHKAWAADQIAWSARGTRDHISSLHSCSTAASHLALSPPHKGAQIVQVQRAHADDDVHLLLAELRRVHLHRSTCVGLVSSDEHVTAAELTASPVAVDKIADGRKRWPDLRAQHLTRANGTQSIAAAKQHGDNTAWNLRTVSNRIKVRIRVRFRVEVRVRDRVGVRVRVRVGLGLMLGY